MYMKEKICGWACYFALHQQQWNSFIQPGSNEEKIVGRTASLRYVRARAPGMKRWWMPTASYYYIIINIIKSQLLRHQRI